MSELSIQQIQLISSEVKKQEITFSHLCDDLIDHLCCDVEFHMEQGLSFIDSYNKVKLKIGLRGLKKIQEDTLYAVDSKYRKMKKTMKITGVAGTLILGIAAMLKILHAPGAGILLTLGAALLAFVFLPSSLIVLYKETKNTRKLFVFISAFLSGFSFILGAIFKVQHWPGAGILMLFAFFFTAFFLLPSLLFQKLREPDKTHKHPIYWTGFLSAAMYLLGMLFKFNHWPGASILLVLGALLLFMVVFPWYSYVSWKTNARFSEVFIFITLAGSWFLVTSFLMNLNLSYNYLAQYEPGYKNEKSLQEYYLFEIGKMMNLSKSTGDSISIARIAEQTKISLEKIEKLQLKMLSQAKDQQKIPVEFTQGYKWIDFNDGGNASASYLLLSSGAGDRLMIENMLREYSKLVSAYTKDSITRLALQDVLQPEYYLPRKDAISGEYILFTRLMALERLNNALLMAELESMKSILNFKSESILPTISVQPEKKGLKKIKHWISAVLFL